MADYESYMYTPDCPFCKFFGDVDGRCENCRHKRTYIEEVEKTMYIKRKDAIKICSDANTLGMAILDLLQIKSADVAPVRHGRWVLPNKEKTDRPLPECSCCGWYVSEGGVLDFTYCPNCGAKMDEVKDNEKNNQNV